MGFGSPTAQDRRAAAPRQPSPRGEACRGDAKKGVRTLAKRRGALHKGKGPHTRARTPTHTQKEKGLVGAPKAPSPAPTSFAVFSPNLFSGYAHDARHRDRFPDAL